MSSTPCLVIAGTHSGVGKTSIATGLMAAFTRRGLRVQGFKIGPDFIDPSFHRKATGRVSHNLDGWMLTRHANLELYGNAGQDADLCIVEGMMGLFDGRSAKAEEGSTAEMAKWLGAPVVLIVDGSSMARSGAAVVFGFESFDPELAVAGVLFNRVTSGAHFAYLQDSVQVRCHAKPLGYLPQEPSIAIPERHLGLHLANEVLTPQLIDSLAGWVEESINLDALMTLAQSAKPLQHSITTGRTSPPTTRTRIALARDEAFQFYYRDNLDRLQQAGAELIEFSPVHDRMLPPGVGAVYLGGGYPELHASALSTNHGMLQSMRAFARDGGAVYAECGGFMYLTEAIVDEQGREHAMCGLFPTRARMQRELTAIGYVELEVQKNAGWLPIGLQMRGHEFRYSSLDPMPGSVGRLYQVRSFEGTRVDGYCHGNIVGSYFHVHFASCPEFAEALVAAASGKLESQAAYKVHSC